MRKQSTWSGPAVHQRWGRSTSGHVKPITRPGPATTPAAWGAQQPVVWRIVQRRGSATTSCVAHSTAAARPGRGCRRSGVPPPPSPPPRRARHCRPPAPPPPPPPPPTPAPPAPPPPPNPRIAPAPAPPPRPAPAPGTRIGRCATPSLPLSLPVLPPGPGPGARGATRVCRAGWDRAGGRRGRGGGEETLGRQERRGLGKIGGGGGGLRPGPARRELGRA